ncbi:unnamed protein product [Candidula unifasciata]|uniref:Uncharacterized protein n=1 Tax=Candidula unifasciata TaxID=100452 RepID=A0A8S3YWI5_9EUPU|nr:unnamed protein product [Candidula unifasciata]
MQTMPHTPETANCDFDNLNSRISFKTSDCEYIWSSYTKNPDQKSLIPVKEFQITHLPLVCRDEAVVYCIRAMAELTVALRAKNVSVNRSEEDRLYHFRGKQFVRTGSGSVINVLFRTETSECVCGECRADNRRKNLPAVIVVQTARHVVFDEYESRDTTVDLCFDDENGENVRSLVGSKVLVSSQDCDECIFECPTHDSDLAKKLSKRLADFQKLYLAANRTLLARGSRLSVAISHFHGSRKHIAVGQWKTAAGNSADASRIGAISTRQGSSPNVHIVIGDNVIFSFCPSLQPVLSIGQGPSESEAAGIEVIVELPDGTQTERVIWPMDCLVDATKKSLLSDCGVTDPPGMYDLVMELPDGSMQIMKDEKEIDYYLDDICMSLRLFFQQKASQHQ